MSGTTFEAPTVCATCVEPLVGHRHDRDVRLDRRERVVGGLGRNAGQRREQRGLARVRHADDPDLHDRASATTVPSSAPARRRSGSARRGRGGSARRRRPPRTARPRERARCTPGPRRTTVVACALGNDSRETVGVSGGSSEARAAGRRNDELQRLVQARRRRRRSRAAQPAAPAVGLPREQRPAAPERKPAAAVLAQARVGADQRARQRGVARVSRRSRSTRMSVSRIGTRRDCTCPTGRSPLIGTSSQAQYGGEAWRGTIDNSEARRGRGMVWPPRPALVLGTGRRRAAATQPHGRSSAGTPRGGHHAQRPGARRTGRRWSTSLRPLDLAGPRPTDRSCSPPPGG